MTKEYLFTAMDIISWMPGWVRDYNNQNGTKKKFTARDALVLERVSFHASRYGEFRGGFSRIGTELGCSVKTVQRSFANLQEFNFITKTKNGGGGLNEFDDERTVSSEWQLQFKPMPALPNCFGPFFARRNDRLELEKQVREKNLKIEAQERAKHPEEHADDLDRTTNSEDHDVEEL
jgi:hypothetical protein